MIAFDSSRPPVLAGLALALVGLLNRAGDGAAAAAAAADDVLLSLVRNRMVMISQIDGIVVNIAMKKMRGVS